MKGQEKAFAKEEDKKKDEVNLVGFLDGIIPTKEVKQLPSLQ